MSKLCYPNMSQKGIFILVFKTFADFKVLDDIYMYINEFVKLHNIAYSLFQKTIAFKLFHIKKSYF